MIQDGKQVRFIRPGKDSFRSTLTQRVRAYFSDNNISNKANSKMVMKTIGMLAMYFIPFAIMLTLGQSFWIVLVCYLLMGFGMAGIGMGVMHDAIHEAYHSNRIVNKIIGSTIYLISGNAATWRIQHNILHHTFTNIEGLDEDMETAGLIRLHPSQQWKPMHRYQKWYAPFVYGLLTLNWVVAKDFKQLIRYYRRGAGSNLRKIRNEWIILIITKAVYYSLFIVLPILLTPVAWYWVVAGFVLMHFTASVILSYVFQLAHMVEGVENMDIPESGVMDDEWMEHQMMTTANFARKNKLISWFVGGLNFQVEHHLFPNICHVHYPALARIVQQTASEFNLPYREYTKFSQALKAHNDYLLRMGRRPGNVQPLTATT
ncbi:MAG TPA: acyl-CoA desaturase [Cryomorphaceae bacterium]|nr:acyl-CoA desaturase [Owenweeksia sp.]MBF98332.1 acyl-CoA desaturase [Owenweeksia sp.]HAD97407.1 acyl-CoA desaturase [Cryomorphaceae bacterium]HBF20271.1 acyl-CoA desaturase [Cryomorphaceae bacterium]HCQ16563.1 acyl-CoA desaturase [Cryomorphaceae bacterium]|tara:strand:- start:865 stop:1986 length:1122 start_codon:yes stop_codon:yes gene_type:complete